MRSLEIAIRTVAVVAIIVFVSSCVSKEAKRIMDTADAVMWTRPDSALAALESIDTLNLRTKAQRARYSLMYTMALNRNRIDTADLRVIQPAARYYERHGSKDDKMKMYYYLGAVYHSADDLDSAIESYIRAKEYSTGSDNYMHRTIIIMKVFHIVRRLVTISRKRMMLFVFGTRQEFWLVIIRTFRIGLRRIAFIQYSFLSRFVILLSMHCT